jgi:hypothetical protein
MTARSHIEVGWNGAVPWRGRAWEYPWTSVGGAPRTTTAQPASGEVLSRPRAMRRLSGEALETIGGKGGLFAALQNFVGR